MERKKIVVVECLSSCANYIQDIIEEGYEPVLLELYCPERETLAYRMPHDLSLKDLFLDPNPGAEPPLIVQAPEGYEETLSIVRDMDPVLIIPGSDEGIFWAAQLSEDLNLPGNSLDVVKRVRDKAECQKIIEKAGLRSIRGKTVSSLEEAVEFYKELGKDKIVVKPTMGGASVGVYICDNEEQFMDAVRRDMDNMSGESADGKAVLLQEYIDGHEYIVDTVSCRGQHKVMAVMSYEKDLVSGKARIYKTMSAISPDLKISKSIIDYTLKVIEALGVEYGPVHTEIMVDEDGPVLIETNGRLSGAIQRASWQRKVLGESESTHSLKTYLHPDEFIEDKRTVLMDGKMQGVIKFLNLQEDMFVKKNMVNEAFADVPGFDYAVGMGDDRPYGRTIDLATASGIIFLAHEDSEIISKSLEIIDERAKNEVEKIYITE